MIVGSAAERIEGEMARLGISLELITGLFLGIWDTLSLDDLLDPIGAFVRDPRRCSASRCRGSSSSSAS